jgi:hypothetical protein
MAIMAQHDNRKLKRTLSNRVQLALQCAPCYKSPRSEFDVRHFHAPMGIIPAALAPEKKERYDCNKRHDGPAS